jgi:hypothetical protein
MGDSFGEEGTGAGASSSMEPYVDMSNWIREPIKDLERVIWGTPDAQGRIYGVDTCEATCRICHGWSGVTSWNIHTCILPHGHSTIHQFLCTCGDHGDFWSPLPSAEEKEGASVLQPTQSNPQADLDPWFGDGLTYAQESQYPVGWNSCESGFPQGPGQESSEYEKNNWTRNHSPNVAQSSGGPAGSMEENLAQGPRRLGVGAARMFHQAVVETQEQLTEEGRRLFVGGVPSSITHSKLREEFVPFGRVQSVLIPQTRFDRYEAYRKDYPSSRRFAYITMAQHDSVIRLLGPILEPKFLTLSTGAVVEVKLAQSPSALKTGTSGSSSLPSDPSGPRSSESHENAAAIPSMPPSSAPPGFTIFIPQHVLEEYWSAGGTAGPGGGSLPEDLLHLVGGRQLSDQPESEQLPWHDSNRPSSPMENAAEGKGRPAGTQDRQ